MCARQERPNSLHFKPRVLTLNMTLITLTSHNHTRHLFLFGRLEAKTCPLPTLDSGLAKMVREREKLAERRHSAGSFSTKTQIAARHGLAFTTRPCHFLPCPGNKPRVRSSSFPIVPPAVPPDHALCLLSFAHRVDLRLQLPDATQQRHSSTLPVNKSRTLPDSSPRSAL